MGVGGGQTGMDLHRDFLVVASTRFGKSHA